MDQVFYCGFNGFKQVPGHSNEDENHTLTSFKLHSEWPNNTVHDVAICWNYLVIALAEFVTKYGLVGGRHGEDQLTLPSGIVKQVSATPRHILVVNSLGECWKNDENKGWRLVKVNCETQDDFEQVNMQKTSCGDAHNIGLDSKGRVYNLPSPLEFDSVLLRKQQVTDVVCGKEHCLLLTEHGQVYSWGGGSRGQLGHGCLASHDQPRLIEFLDGVPISKIAAGGWHSAVISRHGDLYLFGWNESGQLGVTASDLSSKTPQCFSAVEKLFMACCTMQADDGAGVVGNSNSIMPRGDAEDDGSDDVYRKTIVSNDHSDNNSDENELSSFDTNGGDKEKKDIFEGCCSGSFKELDGVKGESGERPLPKQVTTVQSIPLLVTFPQEHTAVDVACGSRHTVVLTSDGKIWSFGWNKYGQLGLGDTQSRDTVNVVRLPMCIEQGCSNIKMLRCGDWGTVIVVSTTTKKKGSNFKFT